MSCFRQETGLEDDGSNQSWEKVYTTSDQLGMHEHQVYINHKVSQRTVMDYTTSHWAEGMVRESAGTSDIVCDVSTESGCQEKGVAATYASETRYSSRGKIHQESISSSAMDPSHNTSKTCASRLTYPNAEP